MSEPALSPQSAAASGNLSLWQRAAPGIVRAGHPVLRQIARPVDQPKAPEIASLIDHMAELMASAGGVGLAAPQIGVALRVIVFYVPEARVTGDEPAWPLTGLINPRFEPLSDAMEEAWEGCLSVPGLRGKVPRYSEIRYSGTDQSGNTIEYLAHGFHARVVQHEIDHLDGVLYMDRMKDLHSFGFLAESIEAEAHGTL